MIEGTKIIKPVDNAYQYPLLIKSLLTTSLRWAPDREIVYADKLRFDYRELYRRINRLASGLIAMGVKPGDVVAMMDWDTNRYLEAFFAIPMIGAVLHTVNIRLSPEQIFYTMDHAEDAVVLIHEDFLPVVEPLLDRLTTVRTYILLSDDADAKPETTIPLAASYDEVLDKGSADFEAPDFDENSIATIFYTTGTTGDPKGVYYSHRQLVLHTMGLSIITGGHHAQARFRSNDVYMPLTPMFHVHAWGVPFLATLMGVKQVFPGKLDPEMVIKLFKEEKVTYSHCVPTILHMVVTHPAAADVDFSGWKLLVGGSALPRGQARDMLNMGIDITTGYGMSETAPIMTLAILKPDEVDNEDMERQLDVRTCAGTPGPFVDLQIWDPEGNALPWDGESTGEVVARAPWLVQGYYKSPEKGNELWEGGYLHTGDVAYGDEDGYLHITDRIKDVIKTGGEWVSSLELESLISQHPAVGEVAVVGIKDDKWGERPLALVVPADGQKDNFPEDEVRANLKEKADAGLLSKWAIPDRIELVDEIPKTSVGKMDKKLIRQTYDG